MTDVQAATAAVPPPATSPDTRARSSRHWVVALGAFLSMVGASVLLSGLPLFTAPIVSDLYTQKDAAGKVVTHVLPNGRVAPVEINGGQAAFLLYFTVLTFAIVVPLMLFSGKLIARFGSRVMLSVGGAVMAAGLALFAAATNSWIFYVAGAVIGVGYGMSLAVIPPAVINTWFEQRRGVVIGVVMAGTGVGGLVWAWLVPTLALSSLGWRGAIWIMALVMLVCTVGPALLLIRNRPSDVGLLPYGSSSGAAGPSRSKAAEVGLTYSEARRSSTMWIIAGVFFVLGLVAAITQVLSIVFKSAAYENPNNPASWTPGQIAFYSSLFMVWLASLVIWKPLLGVLNDKLGLTTMLLIGMGAMAIAIVYLPSMTYGSSAVIAYIVMVMMASGISNATVTPPLVVGRAMGMRDFSKIFSLAIAFYYAGNAIGAPLWGALGTHGLTSWGMYASPVLLAIVVGGCLVAVRRGRAVVDHDAATAADAA